MSELTIPVGTYVQVRDGTPEPPARFNKKLAAWKQQNFEGVVVQHRPACEFIPRETYDIQRAYSFNTWIRVTCSAINPKRVTPVEGAPRYKVNPTIRIVEGVEE